MSPPLPKSRSEALSAGLPSYYTGKPCKHGHLSKRIARNGVCYECLRESNAEHQRVLRGGSGEELRRGPWSWVWNRPIPAEKKLVLLAIAVEAGSRRRCYLLPKAIAKSVGITKTEVMRLVGEMRQSGLIEFSRPKRSGDEGLEFRLPDASERARNHRERAAA